MTQKKRKWVQCVVLGLVLCMLTGCAVWQAPQTQTADPTEAPPEVTKATVPSNPYTAEDFVTEGEYVDCITGPSQFGIDVSYWQGDIDWQQVKAAGVEFAMIRVGWRGSEKGVLDIDEYAQQNYEGARRRESR